MTTVSASEARANWKTILDRVTAGESVTITRNDEVVAVLVHPSRLVGTRPTPVTAAAEARLAGLVRARERRPDLGKGLSVRSANAYAAALRTDRDGS